MGNQDSNASYNYLQGSDYSHSFAPQYDYSSIQPQFVNAPESPLPVKDKDVRPPKPPTEKSKQVKVACIGCKKACKKCDNQRYIHSKIDLNS